MAKGEAHRGDGGGGDDAREHVGAARCVLFGRSTGLSHFCSILPLLPAWRATAISSMVDVYKRAPKSNGWASTDRSTTGRDDESLVSASGKVLLAERDWVLAAWCVCKYRRDWNPDLAFGND